MDFIEKSLILLKGKIEQECLGYYGKRHWLIDSYRLEEALEIIKSEKKPLVKI